MQEVLQLGVPKALFSAVATTATVSTSYAMPARLCNLSWQYYFTTNPTALSLIIQGSNDNSNWQTLDSTTVTTGGIRTITAPAVAFVRGTLGSITGGGVLSLIVCPKSE